MNTECRWVALVSFVGVSYFWLGLFFLTGKLFQNILNKIFPPIRMLLLKILWWVSSIVQMAGSLNPVCANVPFLYPLKLPENIWLFWRFQGVYKWNIAFIWVKKDINVALDSEDLFRSKLNSGNSSWTLLSLDFVRKLEKVFYLL